MWASNLYKNTDEFSLFGKLELLLSLTNITAFALMLSPTQKIFSSQDVSLGGF